MDFIKTSSLRALIELTFQRNWNGLIWMSRKGVIQKSEDCPDGSIEKAPNRAVRLAEERMFRVGQIRPSVQSHGRSSRPGKHVPRSAKPRHEPRTTSRASREASLAAAQLSRTTADAPSEPGKRPTSGREHRPNLHPSDHSGRPRIHPATTVPTRPTTRCPADRPDRPSNAAVDPKPVLKPVSLFSSPA
ncbi:unnamed protein product [Microthlaspi erraticum]|uniref:Uncharacterized protein n=1 Tax=Microthlaspi erraticum TaxID=1685480 RepID=A0A6D2JCV4_9BRAS|nr:unnamed protein product [Microthlaspi erraticum]